ncbi:MAG: metal-dependent hydrolase [Nitrospirota bacterium]
MASAFTHGIFALATGKLFFAERMPARFWILTVVCTLLPDLDVVGYFLGVRYGDTLGHRGFFHSLPFALVVAVLVTIAAFPAVKRFTRQWWLMIGCFFGSTASHGVLDAMTNGGYGIAFFSPFSNTRYFLPWRPLEVAPIGVRGFFSRWGWDVLMSELLWIWLPLAVMLVIVSIVRNQRSGTQISNGNNSG